jgi:hypothetical protein
MEVSMNETNAVSAAICAGAMLLGPMRATLIY